MVVRPGEVLELGGAVRLYVVKLSGGKKDIIIEDMTENAVEYGFAHYDGEKFRFANQEDVDIVMRALLSGNVKKFDDIVYYMETDNWILYYFKMNDIIFALGDDDVYTLGSRDDAVSAAAEISDELSTIVSEFLESIH